MKVPNLVVMSLEEYSLERSRIKDLEQENRELKETLSQCQKLGIKYACYVGREARHIIKWDPDIEVDVEKQKVSDEWLDEQVKKEFKDLPDEYLPYAWKELKRSYEESKV